MVGGGQQSFLGLLRSLDRDVISPKVIFPCPGPLSDEVQALDVPVFFVPMESFRAVHLAQNILSVFRLVQTIRKEKIDLIHTNASRTSLYAGLAARILGIPMVWHVRIAMRDPWLDPLLLALSTRVIAISKAVARRFDACSGRRKVRVVYNGLDADTFAGAGNGKLRHDYGLKEKVLIGIVGQIHPLKGHTYLFQALGRMLAHHPEIHCIVVGQPNAYQQKLEQIVEELDLSRHVTFTGFRRDVAEVMSSIDILAVPSLTEGFGRVLIEGMACGKPIVAFSVDAVPEIVLDRENGLLVHKEDVEGLAEAILELVHDPEQRQEMGQKGKKRVEELFRLDDHVRQVQLIYEEVMGA
jgi:glycosyltransferase involved in cell wall biosynthesis